VLDDALLVAVDPSRERYEQHLQGVAIQNIGTERTARRAGLAARMG
jgi:hypothetical protein